MVTTIEQLLNANSISQAITKKPKQFEEWAEAYERIEPHFEGEIPDHIKNSFPNETHEQKEYREKIHESETQPRIHKAIELVRRISMQGKFVVDFKGSESEYFNRKKWDGFGLLDYFFNVVYPFRVSDANALLCIIPEVWQDTPNEQKDVHFELYHFDRILIFEPNLVLVRVNKETLYAFTPISTHLLIEKEDKIVSNTPYYHYAGMCCFVLGGYPKTETEDGRSFQYFVSDFDFAVPSMNKVERWNSQTTGISLLYANPNRVLRGMDCDVCKGKGEVPKRDDKGGFCYVVRNEGMPNEYRETEIEKCSKCKSTGKIQIGVFDTIHVPDSGVDAHGKKQDVTPLTEMLAFVTPDVSVFDLLDKKEQQSILELEQIFGIYKNPNDTQSGVAKDKDREGIFLFLKPIADSMRMLITNVIYTLIRIRIFNNPTLQQAEIDATTIQTIDDYTLENSADTVAKMVQNYEAKPLPLRQKELIDVLKSEFKDNPKPIQIAQIAYLYTNGNNLRTPTELEGLFRLNALSNKELQAATKSTAILERLDIENKSNETIFALLDTEIEKLLPASPIPIIPNP